MNTLAAPRPGPPRRAVRRAPRRRAARACALALVAALAGCGEPSAADAEPGPTPPPAAPPHAVVPAAAGILDLVAELLPAERVAGVPEQALVYSAPLPDGHPLLARPRFERYDGESILALAPDLVIAQAWQSGETTSRLREAGVRVELLPAANDWPAVRAQLLRLGALLHAEERAGALVAATDARVDALAAAAPPPGARRGALAYAHVGGHGRVAAADTTSDAILRLAGLRNLAAEVGLSGHEPFGFEELLAMDPEVLVVGTGDDDLGSTLTVLRNDARLAQLSALREERVLVLEPWLHVTTSQHMVTAAESLRAQLAAREARAR